MSGILWGLASALILLALLASLALMTPVRLALSMQTSPTWRLETSLRLIGGSDASHLPTYIS